MIEVGGRVEGYVLWGWITVGFHPLVWISLWSDLCLCSGVVRFCGWTFGMVGNLTGLGLKGVSVYSCRVSVLDGLGGSSL
jgi:hypothetical protein